MLTVEGLLADELAALPVVACCPDRSPAAARPALMGRAAVCAGGRRPAREIATREPDGSEWSISRPALALPPPTGTAARPRRPRGGLQSVGVSVYCPARLAVASLISHVIPQRLVQMLNLHRWNCSVFVVSRKMTTINYVRNLAGGGVVVSRGYRSQALCFEARQGPAARLIDFARNSPATCSDVEFASLELQRFWCVSKNDHDKLRAKFGWR